VKGLKGKGSGTKEAASPMKIGKKEKTEEARKREAKLG